MAKATFLPHCFFDGDFVNFEDAKVSVATHALQYGTAVFGGIRGYLDQDGSSINIFRLEDHVTRFMQSCSLIKVKLPRDRAGMMDVFVELTKRNAPNQNVYFRPYAYKAGLELGPTLAGIEDGFTCYMFPLQDYYSADSGLSVMVSSWTRVGDNQIPARGKVSGAYINSALAKDEAVLYGFDEAITLNKDGKVGEASACNLMLVRNGVLITPPITADILEGITRRTLIQLARDLGIPFQEREVDRTELYIADELFFCGTGAQVTPVLRVDRRPVGGTAQIGPITRQIRQKFFDIVQGRAPEYHHWLTRVPIRALAGAR